MNKDAIIKLVNEQMWPKTDADVPSFKAGDTITVSYKIVEGNKERVQSFRGVVIQIKGFGQDQDVHDPQDFERRGRGAYLPPSTRLTSTRSRSTRSVSYAAHASTTCAT